MNSTGRFRILIISLLVFTLLAFSPMLTVAQEKKKPDINTKKEARAPARSDQMALLQEKIQMMRMWKLTRLLDLDQKKATMLFPVLHRFDQDRISLLRRQQQIIKEIDAALEAKKINEAEIAKKCASLEALYRELDSVRSKENEAVRQILNTREYAKYLIFSDNFPKEMVQLINDRKKESSDSTSKVVPVSNKK